MTDYKADLHCHSTFSDGSKTPEEILQLALEQGLSGLSITDHDTIGAYDTAPLLAKKYGLDIIPGVEFSCVHKGQSVHILGYSFSLKNSAIIQLCKKHVLRRNERYKSILELLARENMHLTEEEITEPFPNGNIGRPHIALAMIKKGYIQSIEEAFSRFLGEGKSCYIKGTAFSVEETIDIIHNGGGLAVIAHPHLVRRENILNDLLSMKFDGIEGYYAKFHQKDNQRWVDIGTKKGWIITGGSDFHGDIKPQIPLGSSWVSKDTFTLLKEHYFKHELQQPS